MRALFRPVDTRVGRSTPVAIALAIVLLGLFGAYGTQRAQSAGGLTITSLGAHLDPSNTILVSGYVNGIMGGGNMTITLGGVLAGRSFTVPASGSFYKTYQLVNPPQSGTVSASVTWNGQTSPTVYADYD